MKHTITKVGLGLIVTSILFSGCLPNQAPFKDYYTDFENKKYVFENYKDKISQDEFHFIVNKVIQEQLEQNNNNSNIKIHGNALASHFLLGLCDKNIRNKYEMTYKYDIDQFSVRSYDKSFKYCLSELYKEDPFGTMLGHTKVDDWKSTIKQINRNLQTAIENEIQDYITNPNNPIKIEQQKIAEKRKTDEINAQKRAKELAEERAKQQQKLQEEKIKQQKIQDEQQRLQKIKDDANKKAFEEQMKKLGE